MNLKITRCFICSSRVAVQGALSSQGLLCQCARDGLDCMRVSMLLWAGKCHSPPPRGRGGGAMPALSLALTPFRSQEQHSSLQSYPGSQPLRRSLHHHRARVR